MIILGYIGCIYYLMRKKLKVERIFKEFHNMFKTQFQTQIQVFRTDNRKDYFNTILSLFLKKQIIFHQSSCIEHHNKMESLSVRIDIDKK